MRTRHLLIVPILCALVAAWAVAELPKPYDTLARKSIFARDRVSRMSSTAPVWQSPPPPPTPVLTGILREDAGFVALVETPGGGRPQPVRIGDALPGGRGTVTEMDLDCIVFAPSPGETPRKVYIGRNLDGSETALSSTSPSATNGGTAPIEGDDIVSRMRRRRQQEGN